ncbi:MAG: GNAT family N-acetyltransferase [Candidatus Chlorobium antarcticum]|jgi:GNAT superfamily N-acetyltransferase|nr:GNAT family N-acetyltransferase [Candidatus Chlorobium antarcticum]
MAQVRTATTADIAECASLLGILFAQEAEFVPNPELQVRSLEMILENPDAGRILVSLDNGQITGMVLLLFTISTALGGRVALLEDMVVLPQYRRKGIGSILMEQALLQAEAAGCLRITLLTDNDNTAGHAFYRNAGFGHSPMVVFRKQMKAR